MNISAFIIYFSNIFPNIKPEFRLFLREGSDIEELFLYFLQLFTTIILFVTRIKDFLSITTSRFIRIVYVIIKIINSTNLLAFEIDSKAYYIDYKINWQN